jgi:hypothetical protein
MDMRAATFATLVFLIIAGPCASSSDKHSEQSCIMVPESNKLPGAVVRAVMDSQQGEFARKYFRDQGLDPYRAAPLSGVRIKLTNSGDRTYLVGGGMPMTGGDNRWYWLVQESGAGHARILLYVGTSCVQIERSMTGGYRNIWTRWQTAGDGVIREYQWNGDRHDLRKTQSTKNIW